MEVFHSKKVMINKDQNVTSKDQDVINDDLYPIIIYKADKVKLKYNGIYPVITSRFYSKSLSSHTMDEKNVYVYIFEDVTVDDEQINNLYKSYIDSNSDILSPQIVTSDDKIIYNGGIILNNKIILIEEEYESNPINNTSIVSPFLFITSISNYYCSYEHFLNDYIVNIDSLVIKVNSLVKINVSSKYNMFDGNVSNEKLKKYSFNFEQEHLKEYFSLRKKYGLVSLKSCNNHFLSNNNHKNILIYDTFFLTPHKDCGSIYMLNFIKCLIKQKCNVYYCSDNFFRDGAVSLLEKMGVYVISGYPYSIKEILKNNLSVFEYIIVSRFELIKSTYKMFRKYSPNSKLIFFTHDLHHVRLEREKTIINEIESSQKKLSKIKEDELSFISKCDDSLICSIYEMEYLKQLSFSKISYLPICYEMSPCINRDISKLSDMYFIGSKHTPNISSIKFFLDNIYPEILKIQKIKIYVIGDCGNSLVNYADKFKDLLILCGYVKDLSEIFNKVRLNIVPLLYGAGVKGKILEALNNQIPTIATSIGVEGINLTHLENVIVLDVKNNNYKKYASELIKYYNNIDLLNKISVNGYNFFRNEFSIDCMNEKVEQFLKKEICCNKEINEDRKKICVLYQVYYHPESVKDIDTFLNNFNHYYDFTIYVINNNENYDINENYDMNENYHNNVIIIKGDNSCHEFSGYQKGINYLIENNYVDNYDAFLISNETFNKNWPIISTYFTTLDTFKVVVDQLVAIGVIDSFQNIYTLDGFMFDRWIRSNFIMINAFLFKLIKYQILSYNKLEIDKIKIDKDLHSSIINFLRSFGRYNNHFNNSELLNIKLANIYNEYKMSHLLSSFGKLIKIEDVKKYNYKSNSCLKYKKVPTDKNNWENKSVFKYKSEAYLNDTYLNDTSTEDIKKIFLIFYHLEGTIETDVRNLISKHLKSQNTTSKIYSNDEQINVNDINDMRNIISKYDYILNHIAYHDIFQLSCCVSFTIIRNPVYRLIYHFEKYDSKNLGYKSLMDFYNHKPKDFYNYCKIMGNLQSIKMSGEYYKFVSLSIPEKIEFVENESLVNIAINNLNKLSLVITFENFNTQLYKLENLLKVKFKKTDKLRVDNSFKDIVDATYPSEFINKLETLCFIDTRVYEYFST